MSSHTNRGEMISLCRFDFYFCDSFTDGEHLFILISVKSLSHAWLFATPWTAACQASLSITNSRTLVKLMSIKSVMPSNHLILCRPLSACLQSLPASGSFKMSQLFASGGRRIGVSASASWLFASLHLTNVCWIEISQSYRTNTPFHLREVF